MLHDCTPLDIVYSARHCLQKAARAARGTGSDGGGGGGTGGGAPPGRPHHHAAPPLALEVVLEQVVVCLGEQSVPLHPRRHVILCPVALCTPLARRRLSDRCTTTTKHHAASATLPCMPGHFRCQFAMLHLTLPHACGMPGVASGGGGGGGHALPGWSVMPPKMMARWRWWAMLKEARGPGAAPAALTRCHCAPRHQPAPQSAPRQPPRGPTLPAAHPPRTINQVNAPTLKVECRGAARGGRGGGGTWKVFRSRVHRSQNTVSVSVLSPPTCTAPAPPPSLRRPPCPAPLQLPAPPRLHPPPPALLPGTRVGQDGGRCLRGTRG